MGLSERKNKRKDPRNLSWSDDTSRFGQTHLRSLGWNSSSGIGADLDGNPNHIAVARKSDNGGIGMGRVRKEGNEAAPMAGGFEEVLKRLAGEGATVIAEETVTESVVKGRVASRRKHIHSKRLASSSPAALAEILGIPLSSLPSPSPQASGSTTPIPVSTSAPLDPETQRSAEEIISTSTVSVADYFRQKLREKMLARSGSSTPITPIEVEVKTEWVGTKVMFGDEEVRAESKEEKRKRREERRARKEAKAARKAATVQARAVTNGDGRTEEDPPKRKKRKSAEPSNVEDVQATVPEQVVKKRRKKTKDA